MFWQSFRHSLRFLELPQFWLLTILLLAAYALYFLMIRLTTGLKESADAAAPGCLVQVVGILLEGLGMGIFVLLLLPPLLGTSLQISWSQVQSFALLALRAGVLSSLAVALLSFVPILGRVLAANPGVETFLVGAAVFRLTAPLYAERASLGGPGNTLKFPNAWESLAYLVITFLICKLLQALVGALQKLFSNSPRSRRIFAILGPAIDIFAGVFTVLAYASYVKLN